MQSEREVKMSELFLSRFYIFCYLPALFCYSTICETMQQSFSPSPFFLRRASNLTKFIHPSIRSFDGSTTATIAITTTWLGI
mgnify:CR=1 FL=1